MIIRLFFLILFTSIFTGCSESESKVINKQSASKSPYEYVDPFIGTAGHGHTYPGAALPFGMVQLSPDTRLTGWDGCSGYHYSDNVIYGFSHTHLSGTGVGDYGDVLLMPTTGKVNFYNGYEDEPDKGYGSRFSHDKETASPGFYSVFLEDYEIGVDLIATKRCGFHKYTFSESKESNILIDLVHRDQVIESSIEFTGDTEIVGMRRSNAWASDQLIYFVAQFSKPFSTKGIAINDTIEDGINNANGKKLKAFVNFETADKEVIYVKIGISSVSIEGARENLEKEIPEWDFNETKRLAKLEWDNELTKIIVKGGTDAQKTVFYTSLYHAFLNPNTFQDINGQYRGRDFKTHQAEDFTNHTVFSLWDTYRATHPLFTIVQQQRTNDFIKTFIHQYEEGGLLPVWELAANETFCMIGYHSVPVIVDAYVKGIRDYDLEKVYEAMKHSSTRDHHGLKFYKKFGYIPASDESESVSKTLEYAYDDWCIAIMAKELGKEEDYKKYMERAQFYKNVFDSNIGFMRAKLNQTWFTPFDPKEVNFNYTEANSWQYSFCVPQDISGLINLYGGKENLINVLDKMFTETNETTGREQADITGLIGQYAQGNEPSHHMAYLYNYLNQPWKTQKIVRQIMDELYTEKPDGLCGNEDCGQMSSWFVFSAMGFYPVTPGTDIYVIGSPLFESTTLNLENGKQFTIKAEDLSAENIYIQAATLNGAEYTKSFITHEMIMSGGELVFKMGNQPSKSFGIADEDIPVSVITNNIIQPVPYVEKGVKTFLESTEVELNSVNNANIYYTLDGSEPSENTNLYSEPIKLKKTTLIKMMAISESGTKSFIVTASFQKIPEGRTITIVPKETQTKNGPEMVTYASQYSAGGDMALIDFIRGAGNYRTGAWQGYQEVDMEVIIDLGKPQKIHSVEAGFIQEVGSWIFMPERVEFYISGDGKNFKLIGTDYNDVSEKELGTVVRNFGVKPTTPTIQYVKVIAYNRKTCPEWHKGAGGKAWIFADEIVIN